jgi:tRNA A-37 threonylcarbamoyl transferase component Bud32
MEALMGKNMDFEDRASGASIKLEEGFVRKRQDPVWAELEYNRTSIGRQIAERTEKFRVPKNISFDNVTGEIVFERINGLQSLASTLSEHPSPESIASRAGIALAAIHSADKNDYVKYLPPLTQSQICHGDFGIGNIHYQPEVDELVILDWCTARWLRSNSIRDISNQTLDISVFLISLFHRRLFAAYKIPNLWFLAHCFLDSYFSTRNSSTDANCSFTQLQVILKEWNYNFRIKSGASRAVAYYPSLIDLRRFIRNYCRK